LLNFVERKEAERDFNDLAYDVQQREREETVESKARPARTVQASWTNRAHQKVEFAKPSLRQDLRQFQSQLKGQFQSQPLSQLLR